MAIIFWWFKGQFSWKFYGIFQIQLDNAGQRHVNISIEQCKRCKTRGFALYPRFFLIPDVGQDVNSASEWGKGSYG